MTGDAPDLARPELGQGDAAAVFARLFDAHASALHAYLRARVGTSAADDLVGETFLVALRSRSAYDPGRGEVRGWLFGIATNLAARHRRGELRALAATARLGGHVVPHVEGPGPDGVDAAASVRALAGALAALPDGDRDALLLTAWAGLSSAEVAVALDIPPGTVRSRLHRVRGVLRRHLEEVGHDPR